MSADELRKAAETLRERATIATAGPWVAENYPDGFGPLVIGDGMAVAETFDKPHLSDAAYIATMHPGVGLALADHLDAFAAFLDTFGPDVADRICPAETSDLARLINGGAS